MLKHQRHKIMTYRHESIHIAIDHMKGGRMLTTGWA